MLIAQSSKTAHSALAFAMREMEGFQEVSGPMNYAGTCIDVVAIGCRL